MTSSLPATKKTVALPAAPNRWQEELIFNWHRYPHVLSSHAECLCCGLERLRLLQKAVCSCYNGRKCVTDAWLTWNKERRNGAVATKKQWGGWGGVRRVWWKNWTNRGERGEVGGLQNRAESVSLTFEGSSRNMFMFGQRELWPIIATLHSEWSEGKKQGQGTPSLFIFLSCSNNCFSSNGTQRESWFLVVVDVAAQGLQEVG